VERTETSKVGTEDEADGTYLRNFLVDHLLLLLGRRESYLPTRSCTLALWWYIFGRCSLEGQCAINLLQEVKPTSDLVLRFFPLGGEYSEAPSLALALLFCPAEDDALRERDFEGVVVEGACLGISYQMLRCRYVQWLHSLFAPSGSWGLMNPCFCSNCWAARVVRASLGRRCFSKLLDVDPI
jgi:hypothetical protein